MAYRNHVDNPGMVMTSISLVLDNLSDVIITIVYSNGQEGAGKEVVMVELWTSLYSSYDLMGMVATMAALIAGIRGIYIRR